MLCALRVLIDIAKVSSGGLVLSHQPISDHCDCVGASLGAPNNDVKTMIYVQVQKVPFTM